MSPRGSTGPDRPTTFPSEFYEARNEGVSVDNLVVSFVGEDGRTATFDVATLPLPGWHVPLAEAWARRIGPAGELRTRSSVIGRWASLKHFFHYLEGVVEPPQYPEDLRKRHATGYRKSMDGIKEATSSKYLHSLAALFDKAPLAQRVSEEVKAKFRPRTPKKPAPLSGYSDRELAAIEAAARSDVAALISRLAAGPASCLNPRIVEEARATGVVPRSRISAPQLGGYHRGIAESLFVTKRDLVPLLVLFVVLTGWNVETIKELSVEHTVLDDRAVHVPLIKRRRGEGHTDEGGTWEVGRPGRELHHAGGLYLLLHQLMASARQLLSDAPYWAVWAGAGRGSKNGLRDPFALDLQPDESNLDWVRKHALTADAVEDGTAGKELHLHFNRLKTSMDVRRVRQAGGHLPTAARSNTVPVLFSNYLNGDSTTLEWAREEMAEGLVDVERAALDIHRNALSAMGRTQLTVRPVGTTVLDGPDEPDDTAWTACADHAHHPLTGRRCTQSFLTCFHCANSIISREHLPGIMGLLDALEGRREFMDGDSWWRRYGPTWTAIRYDVLPKFTEKEVMDAIASSAVDALLDIVEPRWEQP